MTDIDKQIQARIEQFAAELNDLLRDAAIAAVRDALGGAASTAIPEAAATQPAAPAQPAAKPKGRKRTPTKAPRPATQGKRKAKGGRRSAAEMQNQQDNLVAYVAANPGQKMEVIAKALGASSGEMNRPVNKLIASGKIRREGQKRASRYFTSGKR